MEQENKNKSKNIYDKRKDTNEIFVGKKDILDYIRAILTKIDDKNESEVIVAGRGLFTSKAIDVVCMAIDKFLIKKIKVDDITIGSQPYKDNRGKDIRVSTIQIKLKKIETTKVIENEIQKQ